MYPIPSTEKLIETKICRHCQTPFPITDKDLEFYDKVSPTFGGKKYQIPTPTLCPDCRQQRRLTWRNERKLYKRKCDATGKDIISIYSPDKPYKVYHQDVWVSDRWDPMEYGRSFDFEMSFFEQVMALSLDVPQMGLVAFNNENAPYANFVADSRNVYLSPDTIESNNVYHSTTTKRVEDGVDLLDVTDSQNCYECVSSERLYDCHYCGWSHNCSGSRYLFDCQNIQFGLFCVGIRDKKYCVLNREVGKEEYDAIRAELASQGAEKYLSKYRELLDAHPRQWLRMYDTENASGDVLLSAKNSSNCFYSTNIEDCRYVVVGYDMENCMDITIHNPDCENDYEAISGGGLKNAWCNVISWYADNIAYCSYCFSSSHLFWCIGLRNKSYCILNKQHTKEEYETLVPKIIEHMMKTGEWWEFFPSSLSPFGYNETVAQEYYPMTRDQILASPMRGGGTNAESTGGVWLEAPVWSPLTPLHKGGESETFLHWTIFNWSDYEPPFPKVEKIIPASKLPQDIKDIPDDILNWAIECEVTKKPFRIIKQELEFYRKHHLPIPKRHPDQRHLDRMAQRNPRKLFERKCDCCQKDMITTYAPERPERVYCEECYNKEVIG